MADNRIWLDTAFAKKDSASWAKDRTSVLACSLTSYRVAAGSATCGHASISATGNVCAGCSPTGQANATRYADGGQDREAHRWLEAHERWAYDDSSNVQALRRLICLCTDCHTTTHFGLASINGKSDEAFKHLCTVTGIASRPG